MTTALSREVGGVSLATQSHYIIRRKFWSVFERVFRVFTGDGQLIMYIQHPLLKLREEFMVYADEARTRPLMRVKSREKGGQGYANADVTFAVGDGGGSIHTAAQISGKAASMGEGVMVSILDALINDFTQKLKAI